MSNVDKKPDAFRLDQIDISNLTHIKITDVSEGRSQGRRFTVTLNGKVSEELLFRDIFKQVQKIAKNEHNIENLKIINGFLDDFEMIDKTAEDNYKIRADKSLRYRINTWLHRALQWGTHSERIKGLEEKIDKRVNKLDKEFRVVSNKCPGNERDSQLNNLAEKYLKGNNLDNAKKTIELISDRHHKESMLEKIIPKYETKQAIELAKTSFKKEADRDRVLLALGELYLENGNLDSAQAVINELNNLNVDTSDLESSIQKQRVELLVNLGQSHFDKGDLEAAFDTVGELTSINASVLIRKIIKDFISQRDLGQSITDLCKGDIGPKELNFISEVALIEPALTLRLLPDIHLPTNKKDRVIQEVITTFINRTSYDKATQALEFIADDNLKQALQEQIASAR